MKHTERQINTEESPVLNVRDILDRLKQSFGTETDRELSDRLQIGASSLSNWRQRNSMPYSFCVGIALKEGLNLDWLILGREPEHLNAYAAAAAIHYISPASVLLDAGMIDIADMGELFVEAYPRFLDAVRAWTSSGRSPEDWVTVFLGTTGKRPVTMAVEEALEIRRRSGREIIDVDGFLAKIGAPIFC